MDDVLIGYAFSRFKGDGYISNLKQLRYGFHPKEFIWDNDFHRCVSYRLKTVPPTASCSGYSWEPNEIREHDQSKMMWIHNKIKETPVKRTSLPKLSDMIVPESEIELVVSKFYKVSLSDAKLIQGLISHA